MKIKIKVPKGTKKAIVRRKKGRKYKLKKGQTLT